MGPKDIRVQRRDAIRSLASPPDDPHGHTKLAEHLGISEKSVDSGLTRGFSQKNWGKLQELILLHGLPPSPEIWLNQDSPDDGGIRRFGDADKAVEVLLGGDFSEFLCIRSPRRRARRFDDVIRFDSDDIVDFDSLDDAFVAKPYMDNIWTRSISSKVTGNVYWGIGRISSIPELWASLEIIKTKKIKTISIYLIDHEYFASEKGYFPIIGARIVNRKYCLLSAFNRDKLHSVNNVSIVDDKNIAQVFYQYAEQLDEVSEDITNLPLDAAKEILHREYNRIILEEDDHTCLYGKLDTFEKVEKVKDRICSAFARDKKRWIPPLA